MLPNFPINVRDKVANRISFNAFINGVVSTSLNASANELIKAPQKLATAVAISGILSDNALRTSTNKVTSISTICGT